MSEIELKFLLDELSSRALGARVKALKLANGRPRRERSEASISTPLITR